MLPPLQFEPLFKRYLWGGRRLATVLGKPIGDQEAAESWEVVDHGEDQSVVYGGPLAGKTLAQIVRDHNQELFGHHAPQQQFPLLLKYLDANLTLSVQVHPNDGQGALLDPPDLGKTEAWVVLAAAPGGKIYSGLKAGVTREVLAAAVVAGASDECLHSFEPRVGDCVFIQAGTVHALGEGLVIAEIQQASNTTFRLFDWNRVDKDGQPRPLHIEQSLEVSDFERGPVNPQTPVALGNGIERLVECDKFVLDRRTVGEPQQVADEDCFRLLTVIQGDATLTHGGEATTMPLGSTVLLPARRETAALRSAKGAVVLDMRLPYAGPTAEGVRPSENHQSTIVIDQEHRMSTPKTPAEIEPLVSRAIDEQPVWDMHTHLYPPSFGTPEGGPSGKSDPDGLMLWGIDELLTYHYLVAEVFRVVPARRRSYDDFWQMTKQQQADHIWQELFVERSPMSEACRGVLTTLHQLGLDPGDKDLAGYRHGSPSRTRAATSTA